VSDDKAGLASTVLSIPAAPPAHEHLLQLSGYCNQVCDVIDDLAVRTQGRKG
jgi:hypothetical protein